MRFPLASLLLTLAVAGAAHAELGLPFEGTLSLEFPTVEGKSLSTTGSGTAIVSSPIGTQAIAFLSVPGGTFSAAGVSTPGTAEQVLAGLSADFVNSNGSFSSLGGGSSLWGIMPVLGELRVCVLGTSCTDAVGSVALPLAAPASNPPTTIVSGGGAVGVPGSFTVIRGSVSVQVVAGSWTRNAAFVTYETTTPSASFPTEAFVTRFGAASGPGGNASTVAQPGGHLQLVSPILLRTNFAGDIPAFAVFDLTFSTTTTTTTTTTSTTTTTTTTTTSTTTTTTTLPGSRIAVCHRSEEDGAQVTIRAAPSAVGAHLSHGDSLGACAP